MIKVKSGSQLIIDGRNRGNNIKLEVMAVKSEEPRVSRLGLIGEQMIYFRATFMSGNQLEDLVVENPWNQFRFSISFFSDSQMSPQTSIFNKISPQTPKFWLKFRCFTREITWPALTLYYMDGIMLFPVQELIVHLFL